MDKELSNNDQANILILLYKLKEGFKKQIEANNNMLKFIKDITKDDNK